MKENIQNILERISKVINGYPSQYIYITHNNTIWTIRISDHKANPKRIDVNMISFVVCDYYPQTWCPEYQIYIDQNGIDEQGMNIEYNLNYFLNK